MIERRHGGGMAARAAAGGNLTDFDVALGVQRLRERRIAATRLPADHAHLVPQRIDERCEAFADIGSREQDAIADGEITAAFRSASARPAVVNKSLLLMTITASMLQSVAASR